MKTLRCRGKSKILFRILVVFVIIIWLLWGNRIFLYESEMSLFLIFDKPLETMFALALLYVIGLLTILESKKGKMPLDYLVMLILFLQFPEFWLLNGKNNFIIATTFITSSIEIRFSIDTPIAKYSPYILNWPNSFLVGFILSQISGIKYFWSTYLTKFLTTMLCVVMIYTMFRMLKSEERLYLSIIPTIFTLYQYVFYIGTTSLFVPLFYIIEYLLVFKPLITQRNNNNSDIILSTIIALSLPFTHGYSQIIVLALALYMLCGGIAKSLNRHYSRLALILMLPIMTYVSYYVASGRYGFLLEKVFNAIFSSFYIQAREDIKSFAITRQHSMYALYYRGIGTIAALLLLVIPSITYIFNQFKRLKAKQDIESFLKTIYKTPITILLFLFSVGLIVPYSKETFPRIAVLALPFLSLVYVDGVRVLFKIVKHKKELLVLTHLAIAIFASFILITSRPFTFVDNIYEVFGQYDGINSINDLLRLRNMSAPSLYSKDQITGFYLVDYFRTLFYDEESAFRLRKEISVLMNSENIIYMGYISYKWKIASLLFCKTS